MEHKLERPNFLVCGKTHSGSTEEFLLMVGKMRFTSIQKAKMFRGEYPILCSHKIKEMSRDLDDHQGEMDMGTVTLGNPSRPTLTVSVGDTIIHTPTRVRMTLLEIEKPYGAVLIFNTGRLDSGWMEARIEEYAKAEAAGGAK